MIVFQDRGGARTAVLPGWAVALCALVFVALSVLVLALGAVFLVLMAPLAIGAALFARWRLRRFLREIAARSQAARQGPAHDPRVIDAEYKVVRDDDGS